MKLGPGPSFAWKHALSITKAKCQLLKQGHTRDEK